MGQGFRQCLPVYDCAPGKVNKLYYLIYMHIWTVYLTCSAVHKKNGIWYPKFLNNVIINKNKGSPPSGIGDINRCWLFCLGSLIYFLAKLLKLFAFPIFRFSASPDEGYARKGSCALNLMSTFSLLSLGRYFCWWTISPRGYHPPSSRCWWTISPRGYHPPSSQCWWTISPRGYHPPSSQCW